MGQRLLGRRFFVIFSDIRGFFSLIFLVVFSSCLFSILTLLRDTRHRRSLFHFSPPPCLSATTSSSNPSPSKNIQPTTVAAPQSLPSTQRQPRHQASALATFTTSASMAPPRLHRSINTNSPVKCPWVATAATATTTDDDPAQEAAILPTRAEARVASPA